MSNKRSSTHRHIYPRLLVFVAFTMLLISSNPRATKTTSAAPDSPPVTVVSSTAEQLVLRLSLPEPILSTIQGLDGNPYMIASADGAGSAEIGKPGVPAYGNWILIPNGKTASVQVDAGAPVTIPDVLLYPVQIPHADLDDAPYGPFVKDEAVYGTNANYPEVFARLEPVQIMRGQQMAILWIYPYKYNPVQRTLERYPNLTVTVTFDGTIKRIPPRLISDEFTAIYHNVSLNAQAVLDAEMEAPGPFVGPYQYGWDYLILTTSTFQQAANKLAAWRTQSGYKTSVNLIPSTWKAADILSALQGAYQSWGVVPKYVLIIGDAEYIPTSYVSFHPFNAMIYKGEVNTQGWTGTDFYYSTMQYDPTTTTHSDYLPDLLLGRISVDTAAQALARVQGIIDYEKSPPVASTFYNNVTLAADFPDGQTYNYIKNGTVFTDTIIPDGIEDRRFTQTAEELGIFFEGSTQNRTVNRFYSALSTVTPLKWNDSKQGMQEFTNWNGPGTTAGASIPTYLKRPGFSWNGNGTGITNAIQSGSFLVVHRGHGARDHWGKPYYSNLDAAFLQNPSLLPVVWSVNCETGWFDNETDLKPPPGYYIKLNNWTSNTAEALSECFERPVLAAAGDYGALGVIASTRVSYSGYNDYMVEGMTSAIWPNFFSWTSTATPIYKVSAALVQGKTYMVNQSAVTDELWAVLEGFHWFGDPASEIRTGPPILLMTVVTPTLWTFALAPHPYTVMVEKWGGELPDTFMEGAKVTISKASEPQDYWTGKTGPGGTLTFPGLTTSSLGTYDVVVTAPNAIPFTTTLESQPGAAGGLQLDKDIYSCFSSIQVKAADANLKGVGNLDIALLSSAGDSENVALAESGDNTGFFVGILPTTPGDPHIHDGVLQALDGQTITAQYNDANDGAGHTVVVTDTAQVDCLPPLFSGLVSVSVEDCSVHLTWEPASDPNGPVLYTIFRDLQAGPPVGNPIGETWSNSFNDYDCMPGMMLYYVVRARDILGNEENNFVELSIATPGIYLPVISK